MSNMAEFQKYLEFPNSSSLRRVYEWNKLKRATEKMPTVVEKTENEKTIEKKETKQTQVEVAIKEQKENNVKLAAKPIQAVRVTGRGFKDDFLFN